MTREEVLRVGEVPAAVHLVGRDARRVRRDVARAAEDGGGERGGEGSRAGREEEGESDEREPGPAPGAECREERDGGRPARRSAGWNQPNETNVNGRSRPAAYGSGPERGEAPSRTGRRAGRGDGGQGESGPEERERRGEDGPLPRQDHRGDGGAREEGPSEGRAAREPPSRALASARRRSRRRSVSATWWSPWPNWLQIAAAGRSA